MNRATAATLFGVAALVGCGSAELAPGACREDNDCGPGLACMAPICVAYAPPSTQVFAFELAPKTVATEGAAAYTEVQTRIDGAASAVLRLDKSVRIAGTIDAGAINAAMTKQLDGVRVVTAVSSMTDPATAITFEADARSSAASGLMFSQFAPAGVIGRSATLWMHPSPPADQQVPPWTLKLSALAATLTVAAPGPGDMHVFDGRLTDAFEQSATNYRARALLNGRVVSNQALTASDGRFRLLVPKSPEEPTPPSFTIEVVPTDVNAPLPRLSLTGVAPGDPKLAQLKLPPFSPAETFRFPVTGDGEPIAGATLRFRARVEGAAIGEAQLQRDAQTNANGIAEVVLIPGTASLARAYQVIVIPPASSRFEARCVSAYPIVASGSTAARTVAALELGRKAELAWRLVDAAGRPAAGVSVTATLLRRPANDACSADVTAPPATTVSDGKGQFMLRLAPGSTYAFDYVAGAGSPLPLLHEPEVTIAHGDARIVQLPAARLVAGTVVDAAGRPTSAVDVRIFLPALEGSGRPLLLGRALSGSDGAFRVVVPEVR